MIHHWLLSQHPDHNSPWCADKAIHNGVLELESYIGNPGEEDEANCLLGDGQTCQIFEFENKRAKPVRGHLSSQPTNNRIKYYNRNRECLGGEYNNNITIAPGEERRSKWTGKQLVSPQQESGHVIIGQINHRSSISDGGESAIQFGSTHTANNHNIPAEETLKTSYYYTLEEDLMEMQQSEPKYYYSKSLQVYPSVKIYERRTTQNR